MKFHLANWSDSEWDSQLDNYGVWAPYHYSGWALMKQLDNWQSLRIVDGDNRPVGQALVKKKVFSTTVVYFPGGFVSESPIDAKSLTSFIAEATESRFLYLRAHMITPTQFKNLHLDEHGWAPSHTSMSSGKSLKLRLDAPIEQRLERLSFNWRRNLKRGEKHLDEFVLKSDASAEEIASAHKNLELIKGSGVNTWESSLPHVEAYLSGFGSRLVLSTCTDKHGGVLAVRGAVITGGGESAFDVLASTTVDGRKNYASYITFWALTNELSKRGVVRYDLGGVDSVNNKGVYDFKNGTGAVALSYGGEFDYSSPAIVRGLLSRIVTRSA